jgi:hypothetical protein
MKNFDFKINVLAMMVFCFWLIGIIGCKIEPSPPLKDPMTNLSEHILYTTGTITAISYFGHTHGIHPSDVPMAHFHDIQFSFDNGASIKMYRVLLKSAPKIGEQGDLYIIRNKNIKIDNFWELKEVDFLWVKNGKEKIKKTTTVNINREIVSPVARVKEASKQYEWNDASSVSPDVYKLVIIKLDNKIITTGRFNENNEWQIETDKGRRSFNKYPNFKVVEWKEFDKE